MKDLDVSYLRVSTASQVERESIASQRHALSLFFEQRSIKLHFQFEDDGVSGGIEVHKRPQGSELYRLIGEGRVRRLFVFALDRIGRDTIDSLLFLRLAETHGTQVIGISDGTDTSREGSTLETEIKAVVAAQYRRDRVRQSKAGLRRRAAEGKVSTRPPFGFCVIDGRLAEDELKAEVMRDVFKRAARGDRTSEIVSHLNSINALSPSERGWRHDTLIYLLKHPAYKGSFPCFVTARRRSGGGKRIKRDPAEKLIIKCPAIVPAELFDAVQDRIRFNRQWDSRSRNNNYLLKSLIRCGECGRAYVGHAISGRKYKQTIYPKFFYYECGTLSNRDYDFCGNVRVNARRLESIVWDQIESFISSPSKALERLVLSYNAVTTRSGASEQRTRKKLEMQSLKNREARDRLTLAVARGIVSDTDAARAHETLRSESGEIDRQIQELESTAAGTNSARRRLFDAESLLRALREKLDQGLSFDKKAEIVRCLVRQILVKAGDARRPKVSIQYVFSSPFGFSGVGSAFSASSRKK